MGHMRPIDALRLGWRVTTRRAAAYQFEVAIAIVYFLLLGPGALVGKLTRARSLELGASPRWHRREPVATTLADLERQF